MAGDPAPTLSESTLALPRHLAVIMDGNGRWARKRGLPRLEGHRRGARAVRRVVRTSRERGIANLTLFALSTQNLSRPPSEVGALMSLLKQFMRREREEMVKTGIRFTLMGDRTRLAPELDDLAREVERVTAPGTAMHLTVAVAYGGQEDLVVGLRRMVEAGGPMTADLLERHLWSAHLPPVDLLIRTGGERRISNFLLWHVAYAELYFTDVLWPDFDVVHFDRALDDFSLRQRRFGQVSSR